MGADIAYLLQYINALKNHINKSIEKIVPYLKDVTEPLEDRWDTFFEVHQFLPKQPCGNGFINIFDKHSSLYDAFRTALFSSMSFVDMLEKIKDPDEQFTQSDEAIAAWKEKVLASGYGSFTYDW